MVERRAGGRGRDSRANREVAPALNLPDGGAFYAKDGTRLHARHFVPERPARADVVIVHGLKDHCGRYEPVANDLARRGYAVHAFDLRGHGRSGGRKYYVERIDEYVSDLAGFVKGVSSPARPLFVLAHSMGAVVACAASIDGSMSPDGMVLTGAALLPGSSVSPLLVRAASVLGRFFPNARVLRFDVRMISRDDEVVRRALADPLADHGPSPARTGYELLKASRLVLARAAEIAPRLLILHGSADRLADPAGSVRLHEAMTDGRSTLILYPGLYHEVLNEPEKDLALQDIVRWLDECSAAG